MSTEVHKTSLVIAERQANQRYDEMINYIQKRKQNIVKMGKRNDADHRSEHNKMHEQRAR